VLAHAGNTPCGGRRSRMDLARVHRRIAEEGDDSRHSGVSDGSDEGKLRGDHCHVDLERKRTCKGKRQRQEYSAMKVLWIIDEKGERISNLVRERGKDNSVFERDDAR